MQHNYSTTGTDLKPVELDDQTLIAIGRMFRAAAEIEDIVTMYLCAIAKLSEGHAIMLLGKAPLSKKLDIARNFAKAHGDEELDRFKRTLGFDQLQAAIEFRNILAHGAMLGITDEGRIAFRTSKQIGQDPTSVTMEVVSYLAEDFQHCAAAMDLIPAWLEQELGVADEREARKAKPLHAHAKAPSKRDI